MEDEGRPLGTGLHGQVPNHPKLLWSKARVVSVGEKALGKESVRWGSRRRTQVNHRRRVETDTVDIKTGVGPEPREESTRNVLTVWAVSGVEVA